MRLWMIAPVGLALVTAACGDTTQQRAASGGLGGAAAGAVVGGPVGAVVGGAAGAAGGAYRDDITEAVRNEDRQGSMQTAQAEQGDWRRGEQSQLTNREVRQAQQVLQEMGLYEGRIDGIYGPRTQSAVEQYQQRQNLPQTAALDQRTLNSLRQQAQAGGDMRQQQQQNMDMQQRQQQQQQREQQGMAPGQRQELRQDMEEQRQELRQDMQEQRQELQQEMNQERQEMQQEMNEPQTMPRQ